MPNRALLRTTMEMVEAAENHDNQWFAYRVKDQPGTETYCFATFAVFIAYPEAELLWNLEVDGCEFAMKARMPDGTEQHIENLAARALELGNDRKLFKATKTKADLRRKVDKLAPA